MRLALVSSLIAAFLAVGAEGHRAAGLSAGVGASASISSLPGSSSSSSRRDPSHLSGRKDEALHCNGDNISGSKRAFKVTCAEKGYKVIIRGSSTDANVKTGYLQMFDLIRAPSFSYHFISSIQEVDANATLTNGTSSSSFGSLIPGVDENVTYEGARITLLAIEEIDPSNATVATLDLTKVPKSDWSAVVVTKATAGNATFFSAASNLTTAVAGKGTVTLSVSVASSLDDSATAESVGLLQDNVKWNLNLTNWNKPAGNRLVLHQIVRSSRSDFGEAASLNSSSASDSTALTVGKTSFSWASSAVVSNASASSNMSVALNAELFKNVQDSSDARFGEQSAHVVNITIGTTDAFSSFYWDPAVGAPDAQTVDNSTTTTTKTTTTTSPTSASSTASMASIPMSASPSSRRDPSHLSGRKDEALHCNGDNISGSKRAFKVTCAEKGYKVIIRGSSTDANVKTGYLQMFDLIRAPSFSYHFVSSIQEVDANTTLTNGTSGSSFGSSAPGVEENVTYEGARITLLAIEEVDVSNATVATLDLTKLPKSEWSAVVVTKATAGNATFFSAASSLTTAVTGRGTITLSVSVASSLDDAATAESVGLLQDTVKWNLNLTNWNKPAGNRLVLHQIVRSSRSDFGEVASLNSSSASDSTALTVGKTSFSWASSAVVSNASASSNMSVALNAELFKNVQDSSDARFGEQSAHVVNITIGTTDAFSSFYWDPAVGAPDSQSLDSSSSTTTNATNTSTSTTTTNSSTNTTTTTVTTTAAPTSAPSIGTTTTTSGAASAAGGDIRFVVAGLAALVVFFSGMFSL